MDVSELCEALAGLPDNTTVIVKVFDGSPCRLEMKEESHPAPLDWRPVRSGLDAVSRHAGAEVYHLHYVRPEVWAACLGMIEIFRGNPADCMDACAERERNPDGLRSGVLEAAPPIPPKDPIEECDNCPHRVALEEKLAELPLKPEAPTLNWINTPFGLMAKLPGRTEDYRVSMDANNPPVWSAYYSGVLLWRGTLSQCQTACEERERNPDRPPPKTEQ